MFPLETCKYNIQPNPCAMNTLGSNLGKFVNLVLKYITKAEIKDSILRFFTQEA